MEATAYTPMDRTENDKARVCAALPFPLVPRPDLSGTYHLDGQPATHWAGLVRAIMAEAGLDCAIEEIASADYPVPAPRPLNSRLDCSALQHFGLTQPDWRAESRGGL